MPSRQPSSSTAAFSFAPMLPWSELPPFASASTTNSRSHEHLTRRRGETYDEHPEHAQPSGADRPTRRSERDGRRRADWAVLRNAVEPDRVHPGAVLVAGSERFWSVARVTAIDGDGQ